MNLKEDRIYIHFSNPWRFVGCTIDEIAIFLGGFGLFSVTSPKYLGAILFVSSLVGIWLLKRFKKRTEGFSIRSALHWYLGIKPQGFSLWPPSYKRWWLS